MKKIRDKFAGDEDFTPEKVKKASVAACGLCQWVLAMEVYDRVAKEVEPKKKKLAQSEAELEVTMEGLRKKQAALKKVEDELAALQQKLKEAEDKKEQLEQDVDLCRKKLVRADTLIKSLGGERDRWSENVANLKVRYTNLTGDVLIAAALMAYLGPFTADFRVDCVKDWVGLSRELDIPCSDDPSIVSTLGNQVQIRQWQIVR